MSSTLLKHGPRKAIRLWQSVVVTPGALKRLEGSGLARAGELASAVRATMRGAHAGSAAAEGFRAIEAQRAAIAKDPTVIPGLAGSAPMPLSQVVQASRSPKWCRYLYNLVREVKPERCLEFGTCVGMSASYQSLALRMNSQGGGVGGRMVTMEGNPARAERSRKTLADLGFTDTEVVAGLFDQTLAGVLARFSPIDFVFVDGHHDEHATRRYFEQLLPHLSANAVLLFDDIAWSAGMKRAWSAIRSDPRLLYAIDQSQIGVCIVGGDGASPPKQFQVVVG